MDRALKSRLAWIGGAAALLILVVGAYKFWQDGWRLGSTGHDGDFWVVFPTQRLAWLRRDFPPAHRLHGWYYGPMVHFLSLPLFLVPRWSLTPLVWSLALLVPL